MANKHSNRQAGGGTTDNDPRLGSGRATGNQYRAAAPFRARVEFAPTDELLTPDEVAVLLKVTVRTVERWQQEGVLPFLRLGHAVRFYWPAVVEHLISNFTVCRSLRSATGEKLKAEIGKSEIALPHPGPLPPAAAGRRGSLIAKGGRP
jgi:excisionase family DNA binding protein